jgi:hypothetical protein
VHKSPFLCRVRSQGSVHVEYLQKTIKIRIIGGHSPREGVNHIYLVLWFLCVFCALSCLCDC